ncbi:MAG: ABC transporter permease [Solirubrobacterales bacterium]|nr:MAG: ABC transporter permease [Solirubrobacterales bacterium]
MHISFFLREALRAMRRNAAPTFAALATVLVTLLVLGVFIPAVEVTNDAANSVRGRLIVDVYMKNNATSADEVRVRKELLATPHVKAVQFVSKAAAYAQQSKLDPAAYTLLATNPLPDTFHVSPDNPGNVLAINSSLTPKDPAGQRGVIDASIQSVSNKKGYTKKALQLTSAVQWGGLAFALLLVLASVLLIANTIRLSLYARRREVEVMKLVGATDWFIRWPFVIEGVVVGAAGAVLSVAVLGIAKVALLDPLFAGWSLVGGIRTIAFPALLAILMLAGVIVSALGSGLSLRRFLRV